MNRKEFFGKLLCTYASIIIAPRILSNENLRELRESKWKHIIKSQIDREDIINLIYSVDRKFRLNAFFIMDFNTAIKIREVYSKWLSSDGPMIFYSDEEPDEIPLTLEGYRVIMDDYLCDQLLKLKHSNKSEYNIFFGTGRCLDDLIGS
jgi:hypothetical protein